MAVILLVRHGQTEWSRAGRHTGRTDVPLTDAGRQAAAALGARLAGRTFAMVRHSPMSRAAGTATLAGLSGGDVDPDLLEWDYGRWEGRTTADIRAELGDAGWTIWRDPIPPGDTPGEQLEQVVTRVRRVLDRCLPVLTAGRDVALVAHGHVLRILTATWLGQPPQAGRLYELQPAGMCELGFEHDQRVIHVWNR